MDIELYLASKSPRRKELLAQLGVRFACIEVDVDESQHTTESGLDYVQRVAKAKALAGRMELKQDQSKPVLGADTCIVLEEEIITKPQSASHAKALLHKLSGKTHKVLTAICLCSNGGDMDWRVSTNTVTFAHLSETLIDAYVASKEGLDKAGAYAIQGKAQAFISRLEGSYSGVVGLPLCDMRELCERHGISYWYE